MPLSPHHKSTFSNIPNHLLYSTYSVMLLIFLCQLKFRVWKELTTDQKQHDPRLVQHQQGANAGTFLVGLVEHSWTMSGCQASETDAHPGSSWQTQLRGQAAYASCAHPGWRWHQRCPQGKCLCWSPSVLPSSSASWWLKHWRSKVLGVSPVGPMPVAVCSWTTRPLSCTAAGGWWSGPANRTRVSTIWITTHSSSCARNSNTDENFASLLIVKVNSVWFFKNPNDSKSGLTCQRRYIDDQKNLNDVNTDFSISLSILQPVLRKQHQFPNQPKQDTLFYILLSFCKSAEMWESDADEELQRQEDMKLKGKLFWPEWAPAADN